MVEEGDIPGMRSNPRQNVALSSYIAAVSSAL